MGFETLANPEVLKFLDTQRVCVFAIEMPDGSPHASTVHFASLGTEPIFMFETSRRYRKAEALFYRLQSRASLAAGFEEGSNSKTLQVDGVAELVTNNDPLMSDYLKKFPEKVKKLEDPNIIFFKFIPTWWQFTDWSRPEGKTVYLSDGSVTIGT